MEEKKQQAKEGQREYSESDGEEAADAGVQISQRDLFIVRRAGEMSHKEIAKAVNDEFGEEIGRRRVGQIISNHDV
jgi:DNA-directed RNA polymerase alpha subunit